MWRSKNKVYVNVFTWISLVMEVLKHCIDKDQPIVHTNQTSVLLQRRMYNTGLNSGSKLRFFPHYLPPSEVWLPLSVTCTSCYGLTTLAFNHVHFNEHFLTFIDSAPKPDHWDFIKGLYFNKNTSACNWTIIEPIRASSLETSSTPWSSDYMYDYVTVTLLHHHKKPAKTLRLARQIFSGA